MGSSETHADAALYFFIIKGILFLKFFIFSLRYKAYQSGREAQIGDTG